MYSKFEDDDIFFSVLHAELIFLKVVLGLYAQRDS
jgi:hypothetical protein